jgi:ribonuclease HI
VFLTSPPVLVTPNLGEALLLYVATTTQVVSTTLVVERESEGQILKVYRPIYFICEVLAESKARYPQMLLYVVLIAKKKMIHYFDRHPVSVVSTTPLGEIICNCDVCRCILNWSIKFNGLDISYVPRTAIKSQALADFVTEWTEVQALPPVDDLECRTMYFDRSYIKTSNDTGVILMLPQGHKLHCAIHLHFNATNNMAEYEAIVNGLWVTTEVGAQQLLVRGDSKLVVNQVMKAMEPHDLSMCAYYNEVHKLEEKFKGFEVHHSYRCFNPKHDELSTIAFGRKLVLDRVFASDLYELFVKFKQQLEEPSKPMSDQVNPRA